MVFDDEVSTVPFMREGTITPNWTYLVQCSSQIGTIDNIYLKCTWLNPNLDEDPRYTPSDDPSIAPKNNNIMLMSVQSVPHIQKILPSKGAPVSGVTKFQDTWGVQNT